MKQLKRSLFLGLTIGMVFGLLSWHGTARAQTRPAAGQAQNGAETTPEAQSPEKEEQEQDENYAYSHSPTVVKLGGMVGMKPDTSATVFELANFLLLAAGIAYLVVKMVPAMLRDRSSGIQKDLVDARTATEEASARLSSVEARLGKLDGVIADLRTQSEKDSARDEARIKASVEDERKKILAAAEQEISSATAQAQKALQQYAAELAIEQAARKLVVSAETDRLLVQSFAQRLAGDESKKGQN